MYQHPNSEASAKRRMKEAKKRLKEMEKLIGDDDQPPEERTIDTAGSWRSGDAGLDSQVESDDDEQPKALT